MITRTKSNCRCHVNPAADQRAAFVLKWVAARDMIEELRHDSEGVLGVCESRDVMAILEEIEAALREVPRVRV